METRILTVLLLGATIASGCGEEASTTSGVAKLSEPRALFIVSLANEP